MKAHNSAPPPHRASFTQLDIALVALLHCGGASDWVDLEDVAVETHRLMPEMFRWRRYPHLPSYDAARVALSDGKKAKMGEALVLYGGGHQRMLSAAGLRRARATQAALTHGRVRAGELAARRPITRDMARIESHPIFLRAQLEGIGFLDRSELGDLLYCPTNAPASEFKRRLMQLETRATEFDRPRIVAFCQSCLESLDRIVTGRMGR